MFEPKGRYYSETISIGELTLGSSSPIRVQSMTNTDTNDIRASLSQCIGLAEAGCEMIRLATQGIKEVESLIVIKKHLKDAGFNIPLVADVHFNPKVAEEAAARVEKVRINPGNYADKREVNRQYSDRDYQDELERVAGRLLPLLKICKHHGTALRIGVNHGSLSGRIVARYGDTPEGMAESALEFARICQGEGFGKLVFSMKASNVRVMVAATRLLAAKLMADNMHFPLHLGVTEAGEGEDGIIRSATGIGALLEDGLGDTIRVSLTGDPLAEIPVALAITERYNPHLSRESGHQSIELPTLAGRRDTFQVSAIGGNNPIGVILEISENACLMNENGSVQNQLPQGFEKNISLLQGDAAAMHRQLAILGDYSLPIVLKNCYPTSNLLQFRVDSAIDFGSLLIDGVGQAIWPVAPEINQELVCQTAFSILQATRARISRTEFISCPSCGRTLFDIENTLRQVKDATSHLKGLKIAVMGCIVNGPGEMADADYGYVGSAPGKVTLYKGKNVIFKDISENEAVAKMVELIRQSGDWKEIES